MIPIVYNKGFFIPYLFKESGDRVHHELVIEYEYLRPADTTEQRLEKMLKVVAALQSGHERWCHQADQLTHEQRAKIEKMVDVMLTGVSSIVNMNKIG